jgi:hypothetical protein
MRHGPGVLRRLGVPAACTAALSLLAPGCATEVIESKLTTAVAPDATTTPTTESLAGADLPALVEVLREEIDALSRAVFADDREAARASLARIEEAWLLAEPLIVARFGELADQITYDLRRVVELARSAVTRNRPADADKAVAFLRLALASLEATQ